MLVPLKRYSELEFSEAGLDQAPAAGDAARKYFICTVPSTGSFPLCRLLANLGVGIPHEYFNPLHIRSICGRLGIAVAEPIDLGASEYIDALLRLRAPAGVFGAKIQYWEYQKVLRNDAGHKLLSGGRFIELYREDLLSQTVSIVHAWQTRKWDFSGAMTTKENPRDKVDALEAIDKVMQDLLQEEREWRRFFACNGIAPLRVSYESLLREPHRVLRAVCDHIGVEPRRSVDECLAVEQRTTLELADSDVKRAACDAYREARRSVPVLDSHAQERTASVRPSEAALRFTLACVVDEHAKHRTELVLWTLCVKRYLPRDRFRPVVYFVHKAPEDLRRWLKKQGVDVVETTPMVAGSPHCNKIRPFLDPHPTDYTVVTDVDLFFVADPSPLFRSRRLRAAPNNHSRPPGHIFQAVLEASGMKRPYRPGVTLFRGDGNLRESGLNNISAGIVGIPAGTAEAFCSIWLKWAHWLVQNRELLGAWGVHVDQMSFALAAEEFGEDVEFLPPQTNAVLQILEEIETLYAIHLYGGHVIRYPQLFRADRTMNGTGFADGARAAIERLNPCIEEAVRVMSSLPSTREQVANFINPRRTRSTQRPAPRVVLHVGLPKTGSKALQSWCRSHVDELSGCGVFYPPFLESELSPKHQFLVNALLGKGDLRTLSAAVALSGGHASTLLSTEGLSNHLYDFPEQMLERFRRVMKGREVTVFLLRRNPEAWTRSFYKQCVLLAPAEQYHYGTTLSLEEFRRMPRVARLIDFGRLQADLVSAYGAAGIVVAEAEGDWFASFREVLSLPDSLGHDLSQENVGVPDWVADVAVQLNHLALPEKVRQAWLGRLEQVVQTRQTTLRQYAQSCAGAGPLDKQVMSHLLRNCSSHGEQLAELERSLAEQGMLA